MSKIVVALLLYKNKFMLIKHTDGHVKGKWEFPNVILQGTQTQEEAIIRKIKRTLGLDVWPYHVIDGFTDERLHHHVTLLKCSIHSNPSNVSPASNYSEYLWTDLLNAAKLDGNLGLSSEQKAVLNWEFMVQLMTIIGSQTLAIRGSDKSKFGKLFETLILGTLLEILGFKMVSPKNITQTEKVFWLSERADKRESDATLLYEKGKGIRFDIGFIGRGNPEISLDKVSRFEREIELGRQKYFMATIIIVDRTGAGSRIETLAKAINGHIVQMSGAYWPLKIATFLQETLGYQDKIREQNERTIDGYLRDKIKDIGIEELFNIPDFDEPVTTSS